MSAFVAGLSPDGFFWLCLFTCAVGLAAFIGSFVYLYRKRLMEDVPTSRIRSAPQGYVEFEGTGRMMDGPPIISPLTRNRCVWWRYWVEEKRRTGRSSKWITVERGISDDSFLLEDESGHCVVDPTGAKVIPSEKQVWYGEGRRPDRGPDVGGGWMRAAFCAFRYTEERITLDSPVYALGGFRTQSGGPEAFDVQADIRALLEKWKHDKSMMALLDVDKNGQIDVKEWEAARRMARARVEAEHVKFAVDTPDLNILARPRDRRPYILSGVSQASLVRRYWLLAGACLTLSASGGVTLLYALTARGLL